MTSQTRTSQEIMQILSHYRRENAHRNAIVRLGFFGSAARDQLSTQSDVDIVVELREPDLFTLIGIKQELETLFARPVDIVRYRPKMNPELKRRIDAEAVYV